MGIVLLHVLPVGQSNMSPLQCVRKGLAVFHVLGGLLSIFIAGTYVYYGAIGSDPFDPMYHGVFPAIGIGIVVAIHTLNASGCFSVAYALWKSREWGRLLIFLYDGFVFLIFLALLLFSLFTATASRFSPTFVLFNVFVLLICGATIVVCFRPLSYSPVR